MGTQYQFVVKGIDVDDDDIDDKINTAVEQFAARKNIECYQILDFFNTPGNGRAVQITIEEVT